MESSTPEAQQGQLFRFDQSGALLRKVMENAAVGMVLIGADHRLLYANNAFAEIIGTTVEEAVSRDFSDVVVGGDRDGLLLYLDRLLRGEVDEYRGEGQLRGKGGDPVWVLASASLLRSDKTDRPLYVILQTTSIDRQKRAEAALLYTESRWNSALEAAKQGVWEHDSRSPGMYYSPMWRKLRGFSPYEYVNSDQDAWLERVHPDDRERISATVGKQEQGDDGFDTLEYRERHKDGHYVWILSRGRPVEWDVDGNAIRTIGTDTDITQLKMTERALAEEKERLRVTLEAIGDGVISTDAEGHVSFMNPIAEEMTGWTSAEAVGKLVSDVFHTIDQATGAPAIDPVAETLRSGRLYYLDEEVVLVGRSGRYRDVRSSAAPVRTPEGKTIGAVLIFQDITQSRALQKQLAHSASHDALTGLPNRVAFDRALAGAVSSAELGHVHALCYIDLDRFKPVNDTAGHAAGDALLRQVSDAIRRCARADDFAARIGGDEFALLLTDCSLPHAQAVASKIVSCISAIEFHWNGVIHRIGASVGIAMIAEKPGSELGVVGEADAACYAAKRAGRGRVVVYSSALAEPELPVNAA